VRWHRINFRPGEPAELVVRPHASEAEIRAAIDYHTPWLERQLADAPEARLGLDRLTLTEEQGRREARARITLLAQSEAAALGVEYSRISLRDQRSRWGSCSNRRNLSFNWRLVLAPHDVLDYVVVHEVCHLVELHHGPAFWNLVRRRRPYYADSKRWLDDHGWEILAYSPPRAAAA
jgi:predicted metal-dependent hydrolase